MRTLAEEPKSGESSSKNSTGLHLRQAAFSIVSKDGGRGCGGESWSNYKIHYGSVPDLGAKAQKRTFSAHLRKSAKSQDRSAQKRKSALLALCKWRKSAKAQKSTFDSMLMAQKRNISIELSATLKLMGKAILFFLGVKVSLSFL